MKKIIHAKTNPIEVNTFTDLARVLRFPEDYLSKVISRINVSYVEIIKLKKDGSPRKIHAPLLNLKGVQNSIVYNYLNRVKIPGCVYGCGPNRSIIENALKHRRGKYMINFDIANFFPSVHHERILQLFIDLGASPEMAKILCRIVTRAYSLPQGAPTSPYLSSLVLDNLDRRIGLLASKNRVTYTRYFDDITLSGKRNVFSLEKTIENIIITEGYKVKLEKRYKYTPDQDKKVTGIIIKKDGSLDVEGKDKLRAHLLNLKNFGFSHIESSSIEKERLSLQGKVAFIKSVDPTTGKILRDIFDAIDW